MEFIKAVMDLNVDTDRERGEKHTIVNIKSETSR